MPTKLFHLKHEIFCKLYTLSKLVLYTFTFSLASRAFGRAKYTVVCTEFPMGSKFHFSQWKIYSSQFIFIDKYVTLFTHWCKI